MGVENYAQGKFNVLPSHPKFSWDIKEVLWPDGRGPLDGCAESVEPWSSFHDLLDDLISNKVPSSLRGILLKFQIFGHARDQARNIGKILLQSSSGADEVVSAIFRRDLLSVLLPFDTDVITFINARRETL